ncbi:hypothetical protein SCUCBS95973_007146 [Sporothrix curviconia]|uniref:Uncharacterized protein n=1 Tax=Sporothrix curviconia TaxID=1260050 RepID=A0ABP0CCM0_9PEZI
MAFERAFNDGPNGLVSLMKGQDTLSGWDVLMSYSTVQLNALLAERAAALKIDTPTSWEAVSTDLLGLMPDRTLVFSVQLLQPTLQFVDTSNAVTLTFGLAGSFQVKDVPGAKPVPLPSGLTCELSTSLVNAAGQWQDQGWVPAEGSQPAPDSFVTALEPGASVARGICIDLSKCKAVLSQVPGAAINGSTMATLKPLMASFIEEHFASHGLRLCLAAVSNHYNVSDKASAVLQPTHFCFTVAGGVLMIWIGLKGGRETGTRASGQTALVFAPGAQAVSPIPQGSTASIVFSHDTMANLFLKPSLKASPSVDDTKEVKCTSIKTQAGLTFEFTLKSNNITIDADNYSSRTYTSHVDGCTVDLNETPVTLTVNFKDTTATPSLSAFQPLQLAWKSNSKSIKSSSRTTPDDYERSPSSRRSSGRITFKYGGHGAWTASKDPAHHPNQLGVSWALDAQLTSVAEADQPDFWDSFFGGMVGEVPPKYRNLTLTAPTLDLTLTPLDYFLTTNLLLPGQHVFLADAPVADSSTSGIAAPRDVILTGRVAVNSSTANTAQQVLQVHRELLEAPVMPALVANVYTSMSVSKQYTLPSIMPFSNKFSNMSEHDTPVTLQREKTLDDLKDALFGFPANNLLGDYMRMIEQADASAETPSLPVRELLGKYGLGHLADINILSLWGASVNDLFAENVYSEAATDNPVSSLDLRLFASAYVVHLPAGNRGEQFLVNPITGAIRMRGHDVVTMQSYDAEAKRVLVTWQVSEGQTAAATATYSASFSVVADKERFVVGSRVVGTVRLGEGEAQPFEAYSRGYLTETAQDKDAVESDTTSTYFTMVYEGLGILAYGATLALFSCNSNSHSAAETKARARAIADQKRAVDKIHTVLQANVETATKAEYIRLVGDLDDALADLASRVDGAAAARLADIIASNPGALVQMADAMAYEAEVRNAVANTARETLKAEAPAALCAVTQRAIEGAMARDPYRNTLTDNCYHSLLKTIQRKEYDDFVDRLEERPQKSDVLPFSELTSQKIIGRAYTEAARGEHETAEAALLAVQNDSENAILDTDTDHASEALVQARIQESRARERQIAREAEDFLSEQRQREKRRSLLAL